MNRLRKALTFAALTLVAALTVVVVAHATSMTGVTVANPTAQSASPTVTNLTVTGTLKVTGATTLTGLLSAPLASYTTTQLSALVIPTFTPYWVQENVAGALVTNTYNLGMATAAAVDSCVYIAVSTSVPAVAGAACHN